MYYSIQNDFLNPPCSCLFNHSESRKVCARPGVAKKFSVRSQTSIALIIVFRWLTFRESNFLASQPAALVELKEKRGKKLRTKKRRQKKKSKRAIWKTRLISIIKKLALGFLWLGFFLFVFRWSEKKADNFVRLWRLKLLHELLGLMMAAKRTGDWIER